MMQVRQQADASEGGFAKIAAFSHICLFHFFLFFFIFRLGSSGLSISFAWVGEFKQAPCHDNYQSLLVFNGEIFIFVWK